MRAHPIMLAPAVVVLAVSTSADSGDTSDEFRLPSHTGQYRELLPIPDPIGACLSARIHPVSRQYLNAFLLGRISRAQFLRSFSLPNSDYLAVADCIIGVMDKRAEVAAPALRQGSSRP
jgi:hypothetical protein